MNDDPKNMPEEKFFQEAASLYVNKQGEDLLKEAASLDNLPMPSLNSRRISEKIKAKRRAVRIRSISAAFLPAAACIALILVYFVSPRINSQNNAAATSDTIIASETAEVQLLSVNLPQGFHLTKADLDNGKMICYIKAANNDVVLVMEEWRNIEDSRAMTKLDVNGTPMYALQMNNYSLLTYKKGDLRFTLTSPYDYRYLIVIGSSLV